MSATFLAGMHGLGDNIHSRAIVRQYLERGEVYLSSSWVAPFADLVAGGGLKIIRKSTPLRTQTKNAVREAALFYAGRLPAKCRTVAINYPPELVRKCGSVLAAMCQAAGCDPARADFRLAVPTAWRAAASALIKAWQPSKPILVYRPLVERPQDWTGCAARNPDFTAYAALLETIADKFFIVSIADLVPGYEWLVGSAVKADVTLHNGELEFETLAGLVSLAALVFCSPGFAVPLAQAVGTPVACVFGGYERGYSFSVGARFASYLAIEPIAPCDCFRHDHTCRKEIDLARARLELSTFADVAAHSARAA